MTFDAEGFGVPARMHFFYVRVSNPLTASNRNTPLSSVYQRHEQEKHREYDQRIREIEHGSFALLVFAASGGMGPSTTIAYKRLASLLGRQQERSPVLNNHAVAALPTGLQPPKIIHHSHKRNKSVCPHPNPVNPPAYGGGQNRINK